MDPWIDTSTASISPARGSAARAYTTDLARTPGWRTTITSIEPPSELEVGRRFSGTTRLLRHTWHWQLEITVVEPERRFSYVVLEGVAKPTVEYLIDPTDLGCRFTMSGSIGEMGVAARLLRPFALPALQRETVRHLDNLRRILDVDATPNSGSPDT